MRPAAKHSARIHIDDTYSVKSNDGANNSRLGIIINNSRLTKCEILVNIAKKIQRRKKLKKILLQTINDPSIKHKQREKSKVIQVTDRVKMKIQDFMGKRKSVSNCRRNDKNCGTKHMGYHMPDSFWG